MGEAMQIDFTVTGHTAKELEAQAQAHIAGLLDGGRADSMRLHIRPLIQEFGSGKISIWEADVEAVVG